MNDAQTMDALYAGAERAKDAFSAYVERIAKQVGADFAVAPLKGKDRAAAKIRDDYGGTVGRRPLFGCECFPVGFCRCCIQLATKLDLVHGGDDLPGFVFGIVGLWSGWRLFVFERSDELDRSSSDTAYAISDGCLGRLSGLGGLRL